MASEDVSILTSEIRELILVNREQIAELKALSAQMQRDNAEFRTQMMKDNAEFRAQMMKEQREFEARTEKRFDTLTAAVVELQRDVEGLKHDVQGLYHWDYWLLSIILVVFAMPQIVAGVKAPFMAVTEGVSGIISLFRNKEG
ncbi:MAG: hypothetical protein II954_10240 [Synergistaceae bacterium]|nr:hypothetical protein [Synergistaceae bacterium]MBQ7168752.1 hypothetical protein [Synergistaceae bacterium]